MNRADRRFRRAVASWLRLERLHRERGAERALAGVFAALPRVVPGADFAARVLERAGLRRRRGNDLQGARTRGLVAACAALSALAVAFVPGLLMVLGTAVRPALVVRFVAAALAAGIQRLAESFTTWETLVRVSQAVGAALDSPWILTTLTLCALISLAAFRLLQGLMVSERSS